jgi:hypothetical protein
MRELTCRHDHLCRRVSTRLCKIDTFERFARERWPRHWTSFTPKPGPGGSALATGLPILPMTSLVALTSPLVTKALAGRRTIAAGIYGHSFGGGMRKNSFGACSLSMARSWLSARERSR